MSDLPAKPSPEPGSGLRRVSSQELEAVIRRATELQFARGDAEEGLPEAEVMRIGKELGLEPAHVRRAIAEVRGRPREEKGVMVSVMGPDTVRAVRTIRRPAAQLGMTLEEYLVKCEYMTVQRRFPDRTRYVRAEGIGAAWGRATAKMALRHTPLDLRQIDVHVSPADEDTAFVEVSVPLGAMRTGLTVGGVVGGGGGGAAVGTALAMMGPDPTLLLGFPIFGDAAASTAASPAACRTAWKPFWTAWSTGSCRSRRRSRIGGSSWGSDGGERGTAGDREQGTGDSQQGYRIFLSS